MSNPIGACQAVIKSIKSTSDGGFDLTLSVNCDETDIVQKLVKMFGNNDKLINVGFATSEE
jgi:hypothetical protein